MGLILTTKTVQSFISVVCEITFLSKYTDVDGPTTSTTAQALFYLNIVSGVMTVVYDLLILLLRGGVLSAAKSDAMAAREEKDDDAVEKGYEDKQDEESGEAGSGGSGSNGGGGGGAGKRVSMHLEMRDLYNSRAEGISEDGLRGDDEMRFTSNPLHDPDFDADAAPSASEASQNDEATKIKLAFMRSSMAITTTKRPGSGAFAPPRNRTIIPVGEGFEDDVSAVAASPSVRRPDEIIEEEEDEFDSPPAEEKL